MTVRLSLIRDYFTDDEWDAALGRNDHTVASWCELSKGVWGICSIQKDWETP